jgi:hypothetical protein
MLAGVDSVQQPPKLPLGFLTAAAHGRGCDLALAGGRSTPNE